LVETQQKRIEAVDMKGGVVTKDDLSSAVASKIKGTDQTVFVLVVILIIICLAFLIYALRNQLPAIISTIPGFRQKNGSKPSKH
jgi:hypothetical protein